MKPELENTPEKAKGSMVDQQFLDEEWNEFLAKDLIDRLDTLAVAESFCPLHLQGMVLSDNQKRSFWNGYDLPAAERARLVAVFGLKWANYLPEFELVADIIHHAKNPQQPPRRDWLRAWMLLERVFKLIDARDGAAFRRIADILEDGGIPAPPPEKAKGGKQSLNGLVFRAFGIAVSKTKSLPTKKALYQMVSEHFPDRKKFDRALKELGLNGLPAATKASP
jgi:hypothetical protein